MGQNTAAGPKDGAGRPTLPPITVARFEEALNLVELMVAENKRQFMQHGQDYRDEHREITSRQLNALEAAQIAAGWIDDRAPEDRAAAVQAHPDLRVHDEPQPLEVLLAAGVSTAPAFLKAALRVTALIELPTETFEEARESGQLIDALDQAAEELRTLDLKEARERATAAVEHFGEAAGARPGKGWALVARSVWQALSEAMSQMIPTSGTATSSWIDSPASTDGLDEPSSMTPPTSTPSGSLA